MKTYSRDFVIAALACIVVSLGVVAWRQHVALDRISSKLEFRQEQADTWSVGSEIREATGALRPEPEHGKTLRERIPVRTRLSEPMGAPGQRQLEGIVAILEDPGFVRAVATHQRAMLDRRFGDLFGRLQLSDDELETLRGLLIEKQNAAIDVLMVAKGELAGGLAGSEVRAATRQAEAEIDTLIQRTLGDERYQIYKAYEATMPQRAAVAQLQERLSYSAEPLQSEQAEALVNLLVETGGDVRGASPGVSLVVDPEERQAVPIVNGVGESVELTDLFLAQATEVLQPRQFAALQELRREQDAASTLIEIVRNRLPTTSLTQPWEGLDGIEVDLLLR